MLQWILYYIRGIYSIRDTRGLNTATLDQILPRNTAYHPNTNITSEITRSRSCIFFSAPVDSKGGLQLRKYRKSRTWQTRAGFKRGHRKQLHRGFHNQGLQTFNVFYYYTSQGWWPASAWNSWGHRSKSLVNPRRHFYQSAITLSLNSLWVARTWTKIWWLITIQRLQRLVVVTNNQPT